MIEATFDGGRGFHFAGHALLSGSNNDLWFPFTPAAGLFSAIERVLVMNHLAVNVVRLERLNTFPGGADWRVVYNKLALPQAEGGEITDKTGT